MPLPTLHAAARAVIDLWPEQPAPLQDLCEAVAILEAVLDADSAKRSKRTKGVAGRKQTINYDLIDAMLGRKERVVEIARVTGVSEMTIRKRRKQLTTRPQVDKSPAKKPKKTTKGKS